jgi:hypothetical protein
VYWMYCHFEYISACMYYDTHYSAEIYDCVTDSLFVFAVECSLLIAIIESEQL